MTDTLRDFAAREAQHAPPVRPERAMRLCGDCGRFFVLVTGRERTCDACAGWPGVGRGE